jgi:DNA helicase-2/ATP-dependent DNA helicase PcrA
MKLLDNLNDSQKAAVSAAIDHVLVLAGAGSGKTRVLTRRIAWLIEKEAASPYSILAVTFTNKAASEMRARIEENMGLPMSSMWVGTFHGIAHRLLRRHHEAANLVESFQILDSDDQYRVVKRTLAALSLDEDKWPAKQAQWYINKQKDAGRRPSSQFAEDAFEATMQKIYASYEEACKRGGMVDFAELLLRTYEILRDNPDILQHYQNRLKHILVDEFQDTNALQYAWLRLLAGKNSCLMLVGDDDQSIYGWRGAQVENILNFEKDYPGSQVIRLEQNYRSSSTILEAANSVINHNADRLGKKLWTESGKGETISVYGAFNEIDEARFIVGRIVDWAAAGNRYCEAGILYRSNAQSRVIEEALLQQHIPYRVYGGLRFFERAEIKDALAYLRLVSNRHDDVAFERVVNTPTRGIGDRTLMELREQARSNRLSLWQTAEKLLQDQILPPRAGSALAQFLNLIQKMGSDSAEFSLDEQANHVIDLSGLIEHFKKERGEKGQMRIENLAELVNAAKTFEPHQNEEEAAMPLLQAFLAHAALEAGEQQAGRDQDCVQMMTLHSAKGLEFPLVFLAGVEEGLFPHQMSVDEPGRLEEERRLCYVGITRAMKKLYLTYAEQRRLYGTEVRHYPSRFIREIPEGLKTEVRLRQQAPQYQQSSYQKVSYPHPSAYEAQKPRSNLTASYKDVEVAGKFKLGQQVQHPKFGQGTVINYEGSDEQARIQVKFQEGAKWLMLAYANLV